MLRSEMMSYEEMDKLEGNVDTDYENICYRIERVIHNLIEEDGKVDMLSLDYAIDDILWDCYQAEFDSSGFGLGIGRSLMYYNKENHMNYEVIYDNYKVEEINIWECEQEWEEDDDDDL
ncbi:MAG: hypothetical protein ACI4NI_06235 [Candidatus Ornithospirochaeta sp.]